MVKKIVKTIGWSVGRDGALDRIYEAISEEKLKDFPKDKLYDVPVKEWTNDEYSYTRGLPVLHHAADKRQLKYIPLSIREDIHYSEWLKRDKNGRSVLFTAVMRGDIDDVPQLVREKIPPLEWVCEDYEHKTLLYYACRDDRVAELWPYIKPHFNKRQLITASGHFRKDTVLHKIAGEAGALERLPVEVLRQMTLKDWLREDGFHNSVIYKAARNQNLRAVFRAEIWQGRLGDMTRLWQSVPYLERTDEANAKWFAAQQLLVAEQEKQKRPQRRITLD